MDKLTQAFSDFDKSVQNNIIEIAGEIGISIGGKKRTEVPNRGQFVYVRLRSDMSELIEAFNDKVFPGYGLPVIVAWRNSRYEIVRRDAQRYPEWEAANPYLARHGSTHSLDKDGNNIGTDPVWVYPYQFIPSLVSPFNVGGVQNVYIHPYLMNYRDTWKYTGNTGTPSLATYKPASGSSLILITIDGETGNPALFATTGSYIPESVTGTVELSTYLPDINRGRYVPLSYVVMHSGTTSPSWANLYDARQFYEIVPELQVNNATDITNIQFSGVNFSSTGTVAFIEAVGGGTASTGTAYPILLDIEGTLETGTSFSQPYLVTANYTINNVYLYCENLGVTGSTIIDVNKNGVSIFTGVAGITLPYNSTGSWVKLPPYYTSLVEGDVLTLDVMQKATGAGNAKIALTAPNMGTGGGGLTVEEADGSPSVASVSKIILDGGNLTNDGGGQVTIFNPIQSVTVTQSRTITTYSAITTGNGTHITELDLTLTPKKAGNIVMLEWVVNYESDEDVMFLVLRNGTVLANSTDGSSDKWSGIATTAFDNNIDSTPNNTTIKIFDMNSLDVSSTYALYIRSSAAGALSFVLNRAFTQSGAASYENMLSTGMAMEINV